MHDEDPLAQQQRLFELVRDQHDGARELPLDGQQLRPQLAAGQKSLNLKGYSLCIWDGWRSVEAQWRLWEVCPDPRYVADPRNGVSNHCRGNTVDITLVTLEGGPVEMPSDFDAFGPEADRDYSDVSPEAAANARLLEEEMAAAGFAGYSAEWWHFTDCDAYEVYEGAAA